MLPGTVIFAGFFLAATYWVVAGDDDQFEYGGHVLLDFDQTKLVT